MSINIQIYQGSVTCRCLDEILTSTLPSSMPLSISRITRFLDSGKYHKTVNIITLICIDYTSSFHGNCHGTEKKSFSHTRENVQRCFTRRLLYNKHLSYSDRLELFKIETSEQSYREELNQT